MHISIIIYFLLLISSSSFSQETLSIYGCITDKDSDSVIINALVEIKQGDSILYSSLTDSTGSYLLQNVNSGSKYKVHLSAKGKVTHFFNLDLINLDWKHAYLNLDFKLFNDDLKNDYSIFETMPMANFYANSERQYIDFNRKMTKDFGAKVDFIRAGGSLKKFNQYTKLYNKGRLLLKQEKYDKAKKQLKKAQKIAPTNKVERLLISIKESTQTLN